MELCDHGITWPEKNCHQPTHIIIIVLFLKLSFRQCPNKVVGIEQQLQQKLASVYLINNKRSITTKIISW